MGNCKKRIQASSTASFLSAYSTIGNSNQCPKCGYNFPATTSYDTFNLHLDLCLTNPNFSGTQLNSFESSIKKTKEIQLWNKGIEDWQLEKAIISKEKLDFLKEASPQQMEGKAFIEKALWFRLQLEKLRIPWTNGSDSILIKKERIIADSLNFINICNMHKEIKIYFEGENVQDAGGLLREWIHLITKELSNKDTGILQKTATKEVFYKLNEETPQNIEFLQKFRLFGKILGKAIFDRIPINLTLCRPLLKSLICKKVELDDIKTLDSQLYESWLFLKNIDLANEILEQDFTIFDSKTLKTIELIPNGSNINITEANKLEYIDLSIKKLLERNYNLSFIEEFQKIIPIKYLQIFSIEELEMLINGVPLISFEEWQQNTEYKGEFHPNHQLIRWFWSIMKGFSQENLSKILYFCTGSSRLSLEGFRGLESNRGTLTKFCIESSTFRKENPFIKAHTCFNRLEVPLYRSFEELKLYMNCIIENNFEGVFGLE